MPTKLQEDTSAARDEKQEALEQWLIDDPGGLLRRKFSMRPQRLRNGDYSKREDDQIW